MSGTDVESRATKRYRREKYVVAAEKSLFPTSDLTGGAVRKQWPAAQTPDSACPTRRIGYNHCEGPATGAGATPSGKSQHIQLAQRTASDTITVKAPQCSRAQRDLGNPSLIALSERKQLRNEKTRFLEGFWTGLDGAVDYPFARFWHWPNRPAQPHHSGNDWCRQPGA